MRKAISSAITTATVLATASVPAFAADSEVIDVGKSALGTTRNLTIPAIISGFLQFLVIAAAVIFFFWLVLGGIKWIMSGGDKNKTEEARNQITAALVGLVIVFSAWAIATLVHTLFNVDIFHLEIKSLDSFK